MIVIKRVSALNRAKNLGKNVAFSKLFSKNLCITNNVHGSFNAFN